MPKISSFPTVLGVPVVCAAIVQLSSPALAQEAQAGVSTTDGVSASASADGASPTLQQPLELGFFGGVLFPPTEHSLRRPEKPDLSYNSAAPEFGARFGFYPWQYVGLEAEGALAPTETQDNASAVLYLLRAHAIVQLPTEVVTPFLVVGTGGLFGDSDSLGADTDRSFHFGVGLKARVSEAVGLRLDVRDTLTAKQISPSQPHWPEILLGLSVGFGASAPPPPPPPAPVDTDGDGLFDDQDQCPTEASKAENGCPYGDADNDGFTDDRDGCPQVAGVAPSGCPDLDPDKDGVEGEADLCPQEAGTRADGCPELDADKDGVPLPADQCPEQPETLNGYQDADGCPDTVPEQVKKFSGVIDGIEFGTNKSEVRAQSFPLLNQAVAVLAEFGDIKLLITGHTDSRGSRERNTELSLERANAVKQYLVGKGIDSTRLTTRGAGPDEPIATNDNRAGRQKNRRIEFAIQQ